MRQLLFATVPVLLALTLAACDATGPKDQQAIIAAPAPSQAAASDPQADALTAAIQAQSELLANASAVPASPSAPPIANDVMWLTPGTPGTPGSDPGSLAPATAPASANTQAQQSVASAGVPAASPSITTAANTSTPPDISTVLYNRIQAADDNNLARALRAVSLSFADPDLQLDTRFLEPLSPDQQDAVRLYHQLLTTTQAQMLANAGRIDRSALDAQLDELFGQQPVAIRHLTVCRRVMGFGVYEPFESTTFLAGRDQKMIVYLELEHFQPVQRDGDRFHVDLQQELTLYSADGLAVWRNEPVKINDVSSNRRHDFFVVQLITLPARLSVGQYRLKVRVTDLNGGSIDEQGLDLNFVADRSLVDSNAANKPANENLPLRQP